MLWGTKVCALKCNNGLVDTTKCACDCDEGWNGKTCTENSCKVSASRGRYVRTHIACYQTVACDAWTRDECMRCKRGVRAEC